MSTFFNWENRYDIGVNAMNDEHKTLIAHMNALHEGSAKGLPLDAQLKLAGELYQYVLKHFSDEEKYMESIKFPEFDVHKIIHKDLLSKLDEHVTKIKNDGVIGEEFFKFLRFWLSAHICGIDAKYGEHAKKTHQAK